LDSDNTVINGNRVQQCAFGLNVLSSAGRGMQSYGMEITGNVLIRNYVSGMRLSLSNGFNVTGNILADNCQGGADNVVQTIEPGICVDPANPGSGYVAGDILTLVGGTGTVAKVLVKKVFPGGALWGTDPTQNDAIHPIILGSYTSFPTNPVSVTGGHGTGAKLIYTGGRIVAGGSGYLGGEVLRSTNGTFTNPVRLMVTKVTSGAVVAFEILDGGGFSVIPGSAPGNVLTFTPDSLSDGQGTGTGFTLMPSFGKRYSENFNGVTPFGICTLGNIFGGIISGNTIVTTRAGVGILIQESASPYNVRARYLCITGNSIMNNQNAIAGQTIGSPIDGNYNFNSVIANNVIYPAGT
jgi:hypothetical protein